VREVAYFRECFRADHGANRHRILGIEHLPGFVRWQERVDLFLAGYVHALVGVRQNEAVHAHHHRQADLLRQLERLDVQIKRFLVGFGEQLNPAGVALRERVGMIVPDVDRCADCTVGHGHHDRQAEPGCVEHRLDHEQQALRSGGGVGARAGGR